MNRLAALLIAAAVLIPLSVGPAGVQESADTWTLQNSYTVKVREVTDGDTVRVQFRNGIKDTVRMVGIDTPETDAGDTSPEEFDRPDTDQGKRRLAKWGHAAKRWLKSRIKAGDVVTLRFDERSDYRGDFNRLLGYVVHDGTNLNAALIRHGLARIYPAPFSLRKQFNAAQQQAKRDGAGVWGNARPPREKRNEKKTGSADTSDVPCGRDVYDCSDFDSYQQALRVLRACPGDPHGLDRNGDGEPCESLK